MISRFIQRFSLSAGLLLIAMAMLHIIGNQGENVLQPVDPVFGISTRHVFWVLAGLEVLVATVCLFFKETDFKIISVLWFTSTLLLYRLALLYFGVKTIGAYYDTMAWNFGVSTGVMNFLLAFVTAYLWLGSILFFILLRRETHKKEASALSNETAVVRP